MRFKDKVVLVTGGNSGIGRAIALAAAHEGARVALSGRDANKGADTCAEIRRLGSEADFFPGDLSAEAQCEALVNAAVERFGSGSRTYDTLEPGASVQRSPYGTSQNCNLPTMPAAYEPNADSGRPINGAICEFAPK
jgi:NAD(P)-dependent dehydrogenase (short-subunit alcohol dehydrogenase family)